MAALPLIALLLAAPVDAAATPSARAIAYADMHPVFARLEALQGGVYLKAEPFVRAVGPTLDGKPVWLVVKARAGDIPVPISAEGVARFPVRAELLAEDPPVLTNAAPGKLEFKVRLESSAPPVERFDYALLIAMQDEADALIAKQGVMARMLLPDFEGLAIHFAKGSAATATVESKEGVERFTADAEGIIHLPYRRAWRKENPPVRLSALPDRITLDLD